MTTTKIDVKYFALLAEKLETQGESIDLTDKTATIEKLKQHLASRGGLWAAYFAPDTPSISVAINFQIQQDPKTSLNADDEVAFLPPMSGG